MKRLLQAFAIADSDADIVTLLISGVAQAAVEMILAVCIGLMISGFDFGKLIRWETLIPSILFAPILRGIFFKGFKVPAY